MVRFFVSVLPASFFAVIVRFAVTFLCFLSAFRTALSGFTGSFTVIFTVLPAGAVTETAFSLKTLAAFGTFRLPPTVIVPCSRIAAETISFPAFCLERALSAKKEETLPDCARVAGGGGRAG